MKKLQDNLAARIAASVILTVSFLLTLLSTAGIVLLASYQAYNDGGAAAHPYLHAAGVQEYYDHVEPVLEGLVHEPQSYQNYLNSLNVHVDVKTTDGTTVFFQCKGKGETSLLEDPLQLYVHDREKRSSGRIRFSDAEKGPGALERFPYQIEDYEIEASPFEYSTSYSPIDESLGDALDETPIRLRVLLPDAEDLVLSRGEPDRGRGRRDAGCSPDRERFGRRHGALDRSADRHARVAHPHPCAFRGLLRGQLCLPPAHGGP